MRGAMMAFAIVGLLAVPLWAGDEVVAEAKRHVNESSLTPADSIAGVVEKSLADVTTERELFTIIQERFGLKEETARRIGIAALNNLIADGGTAGRNDEEREEIVGSLDRDYAAALRSDPSSEAVAREYLVLIADEDNRYPDAAKRIRDVLRGLTSDRRGFVALQVMSDSRIRHADSELFEAAAEAQGLDPLALAIAGDEIIGNSNAEIFERAAEGWLAQKESESAAVASARAIHAFANRGSLPDVLRVYCRLPADAKAILATAPAAEATVRSRGIERHIGTRDVRLTLTAAFILAGDPRAALPFLPAPLPEKDDSSGMAKVENDNNAAVKAVLLAAIDSPGGDAFDLVTGYLRHVNDKTTVLVDEVFDRVATRAGYWAASKWRLETARRDEERVRMMDEKLLPKSVAVLVPLPPVSTEGAISDSVARLLKPSLLVPFVEQSVDDRDRLSSSDHPGVPRVRDGTFPDIDVLRMEARGDEIGAIGASQDVDPLGEASPGGYWIVRSRDGGKTWSEPLYTGLRAGQPYEIVIGSTLPMISDDGVRVEVVVNDLDKRSRDGIALDLKWRDLERDSDHDGLTDLLEERILTDPNAADSDGDGIPDGADPLPQVPFRRSSGDATDVAATVLDAYYSDAENPGPSRRTIFVAGAPADFAGLMPRFRIIVLSEEDLAAASKKFGSTLATHISPIIIDYSGTRAWVQIDDEWRGATFLLEKKDGIWIAEKVDAWVS